jgi:hypothetical protein
MALRAARTDPAVALRDEWPTAEGGTPKPRLNPSCLLYIKAVLIVPALQNCRKVGRGDMGACVSASALRRLRFGACVSLPDGLVSGPSPRFL